MEVPLRSCSTCIPQHPPCRRVEGHSGSWQKRRRCRLASPCYSFSLLFFFPLVPALGAGFLRCVVIRPYTTTTAKPCLLPLASACPIPLSVPGQVTFTPARWSHPPSAGAQVPCCSYPALLSSGGMAALWQGGHGSIPRPGPAGAATLLAPSAGQAGAGTLHCPAHCPKHYPTHGPRHCSLLSLSEFIRSILRKSPTGWAFQHFL